MTPFLEMRNISKTFPGVKALNGVDLTLHRGQVHAMLSGTSVKPPQLDEFIVGDDRAARATEMAELGWREADLMG